MQVQIIRDNLISSLNHCDLVYSVSLGCSTPLFPSITFQFSFLFLAPSLVVSLNSALASPMPLGGSSALVCLCLSLCLLQYSTALAVGPKERMLLQGNQTLQQVILSRHTVWVSLCKWHTVLLACYFSDTDMFFLHQLAQASPHNDLFRMH